MDPKHPVQPIITDANGARRFKANAIISDVVDGGAIDLNRIPFRRYSAEDCAQLAQLTGYSVCGFGELSYVSDEEYERATAGEE